MVEVGQPAPDFTVRTTEKQSVTLASYRGRWLVLYFYPKAFTPLCSAEAKRFRDNASELKALGAEVLGVSHDEFDLQCSFAKANRVTFPLAADVGGKLLTAYGVKWPLLPMAKRITFIIDPQGVVRARFHHELQVSKHLDEVLRFLEKVQGGSTPDGTPVPAR
jgi:peroxiredoxin Q/BCP